MAAYRQDDGERASLGETWGIALIILVAIACFAVVAFDIHV